MKDFPESKIEQEPISSAPINEENTNNIQIEDKKEDNLFKVGKPKSGKPWKKNSQKYFIINNSTKRTQTIILDHQT